MGGLAPGQLKSRRGSHSSPRRLHYRFIFFDRDSETHCGKNSYQLCGTSAFSSPSPCGSLALNGPPDWPSPSPPPTADEFPNRFAYIADDGFRQDVFHALSARLIVEQSQQGRSIQNVFTHPQLPCGDLRAALSRGTDS